MKYFTIKELCVSSSHPRLVEIPNSWSQEYKNLVRLIDTVLDPLRAKLGKPVRVTSGYRPEMLNNAVGGSKTSAHRYGLAADINTGNNASDNITIVSTILENSIPYDQVIIEYPSFDKDGNIVSARWIHVGLSKTANRKQLLYSTDGRTYKAVKCQLTQKYVFKK